VQEGGGGGIAGRGNLKVRRSGIRAEDEEI
jgi:hypothetical protein